MPVLALRAYLKLVQFDLYLARKDFAAVRRRVQSCPRSEKVPSSDVVEQICSAVDLACIWYWKEVLCLQRSATAAYLLRQNGVDAQLIIGVQLMPFKAHAWVEVDGQVVNDVPYTPAMYTVLDRS